MKKRKDSKRISATRSVAPTEGARLLDGLRQRSGASTLASRLRVTEGMVRAVAACRCRPGPRMRAGLAEFGIPVTAWDVEPVAVPVAPLPPVPPTPPAPVARVFSSRAPSPEEGVGSTLAEVEGQIVRLKRQANAADADPLASIRDRAQIAQALNVALRMRASVLGEGEMSNATVARSAPFRRLLGSMVRALEAFPDAAAAVLAALEREQGS